MNYFIPTKQQILDYKVGDYAPDCFGKQSKIVDIHARQQDINGKWFICYYVEFGTDDTSRISHSLKEGQLDRTCNMPQNWTSAELDEIESHLNRQGRKYPLMKISDKLQAELDRIS